MRHPSKVGSFCSRYVRKGYNYDRAKELVQTKIVRSQQMRDLGVRKNVSS